MEQEEKEEEEEEEGEKKGKRGEERRELRGNRVRVDDRERRESRALTKQKRFSHLAK